MRISDWSSDVCSSDLQTMIDMLLAAAAHASGGGFGGPAGIWDAIVHDFSNIAEPAAFAAFLQRAEGRRVGKDCVSSCRTRWTPYHYTTKLVDQPHASSCRSPAHRRLSTHQIQQ